jgi:hypothetical protein
MRTTENMESFSARGALYLRDDSRALQSSCERRGQRGWTEECG